MAEIFHNGEAFQVTDAWHENFTTPWLELAGLTKAQIDSIRKSLADASNFRALTEKEHAKLHALDFHFSVRNSLDLLAEQPGARHTDYGFTGADQLHFTQHRAPCGCVRHFAFDHHLVSAISAAHVLAVTLADTEASLEMKARAQANFEKHQALSALQGSDHETVREMTYVQYPHRHARSVACAKHAHLIGNLPAWHAAVIAEG